MTHTTTDTTEDFFDLLDAERIRLNAELATYRSELIYGFVTPARKARCSQICLRLTQIALQLNDDDEVA